MKKLLPLSVLVCAALFAHAQQNVGIGTNDPKSKLDINGGITIGNTYSGVNTAPSNGAIIEGTVGIGTPTPDTKAALDISSNTKGMFLPRLTTAQATTLGNTLNTTHKGLMIFNITTTRTEFWDGTQWKPVGEGAGGPPSGTAGGDLTGTYPNPTVANSAINSAKILDGSVTGTDIQNNTIDLTTKVNNVLPVSNGGTGVNTVTGIVQGNGGSAVTGINAAAGSHYLRRNSANTAYEFGQINYTDLNGAPTALPPNGTAGGDLQGTYPNPTVKADAITSAKILDGTVTSADIADGTVAAIDLVNSGATAGTYGTTTTTPVVTVDAKGRVTAISTTTISGVAPSGAAGGDLTGNYPNPTITTDAVTSTKILDGTVTANDLAATGVGAGTYNNVTVNTKGQVTAGSNAAYLTGNQSISLTGDVTGTGTTSIATTVARLQNRPVAATAPANGQVLKYNTGTTQWEPAADLGTTYTSGTAINVAGTVINNTGVTSVAGTANQVNVSAATGGVTFTLPQNIHTGANPTFNSVTAPNDFYGRVNVPDTRGVDAAPNTYDNEVAYEFKTRSVIGAPGSGTYGGLMTFAPWGDNSGDLHHQLYFNNGGMFYRQGSPDATTWNGWTQVNTGGIPDLSSTYVRNQTTQQASANFNVSGAGVVGTTMTAGTYLFPAPTGDPSPVITARVVPAGQGAANERTELILFHSNDPGNGSGDDLITLRAPSIRMQTFNDAAVGDISNAAGSVDRMYIRYDGNVGIGTSTPGGRLDVRGNLSGLTDFGVLTIGDNAAQQNGLAFGYDGTNNWAWMYARTSGCCGRTININNTAYVQSSGAVGIGTSGPAYKLHVAGDIYANGGWFRVSGNQGYYFESYGGGWQMLDGTWLRTYGDRPILATGGIAGNGNNAFGAPYGASPRMYASYDNVAGGGISIADDGGFYDFNDAFVQFRGSNGLNIRSDNTTNLMQFGMYNTAGAGVSDKYIIPTNANWGYVGTAANYFYRMYAGAFTTASRRELKRDITPVESSIAEYVMRDLENMKPSFYKFKDEKDELVAGMESKFRPNMHMGLIVDETPDYILSEDFGGVDIYSAATLGIFASKYNHEEIKKIKSAIGINGGKMTIQDFGSISISGTEKWVEYANDFAAQLNGALPVITLTGNTEGITFIVTEKTAKGFKVKASGSNANLSFDYVALAKVDADISTKPNAEVPAELQKGLVIDPSVKQQIRKYWEEAPARLQADQDKAKREAVAVTEQRAKEINSGAKFADPAKGAVKAE